MSFDAESRVSESSSAELKLWLRLAATHNLILNKLRDNLRVTFNSTPPRFDYLAQLSQTPQGMRMGELSDRLMVSNGNITTITKQLEKEELIERMENKEDRRSTFIRLTPKGKKLVAKMAKAYDQWLQKALADYSETNHKKLFKALSNLKTVVNANTKDSK